MCVAPPPSQSPPVSGGDAGKPEVRRPVRAEPVSEGPGQHVMDAGTVLPADLGVVVADRDDVAVVEVRPRSRPRLRLRLWLRLRFHVRNDGLAVVRDAGDT